MKRKEKPNKKDKKTSKFVQIIKKKWLINGTKTFLLVAIIILAFAGITVGMKKLDLTPIDLTEEKLYTLTDESKEKVKDIDQDVNIYFVGYAESDSDFELAKQYKNANEKIVATVVNPDDRPDLTQKYKIESGTEGIIVESGDRYKVLTSDDLVTYDTSTYETISIAEEKLTNAIRSVTTDNIPKVYFLEGYSDFSLENNMQYLNVYLQNEITNVESLNVLSKGNIPDDCDTLVIQSPSKDFDDVATTAITDYINKGGNILWLNAAMTNAEDLPNVNKILAMYGVKPFEIGVIRETDSNKMVSGSQDLIFPTLESSKITEDIYSEGIIFGTATKVNIDEDKLDELNVEETDLATTSDGAYFRTNFSNESSSPEDGEETKSFVVGAQLEKTISEENEETGEKAKKSTLIIYGENYFASDYTLTQNSQYPMIQMGNNKDLVLNSIAYLSDREEDITARKDKGTVTYTATDEQDKIVKTIIFVVPVIIIIVGIVVWAKRRNKK